MLKKIILTILICFFSINISGCKGPGTILNKDKLKNLEDGYVCEYRKGKNAKYEMELVDVDFEFDKQMFIDLYNEKAQYNPVYLRNHIKECDLKLNSNSEELNKINDTQISIRAAYKDTYKEVTVYEYNGDLYFFVLSMGGRTEPEKEGSYYMKISDNMQKYWKQLTTQIYNTSNSLTDEEKNMVTIKVNNKILNVELEDNSSARMFLKKLKEQDIIIDAHDYGNFEKVGNLDFELPMNDENIKAEAGDLILYQGKKLSIYYDTNTHFFTKIGKIKDINSKEELKNILGNGDVRLTFTIN